MAKTAQTYIRFERGRDGVIGPEFGPFEFVQLTYRELRISPNGEPFAVLGKDEDWRIYKGEGSDQVWSDVIIYAS